MTFGIIVLLTKIGEELVKQKLRSKRRKDGKFTKMDHFAQKMCSLFI